MNEIRELMRRFIEDRESLSEQEIESLVVQLRARPHLASELQDQLTIDDLLAQTFDLTRWHFLAQIEQRIRDESHETPGLLPISFDGATREETAPNDDEREVAARRNGHSAADSSAYDRPTISQTMTPKKHRFLWPVAGLALLFISAGIAFAALIAHRSGRSIAQLERTEGTVRLVHQNGTPGETRIRPGDRLTTAADASATVRYPDGTTMKIQPDTAITLGTNAAPLRKRVRIDRGRLEADVARQPSERPMIFQSPHAQAEVLGTRLMLAVDSEETHLKVSEGSVRLMRISDRKSIVVAEDEIAVSGSELLAKAPASWPSHRDGLIFLFETNDSPNQVRSITSGMNRSYTVRPRGRAHLNHSGAMMLTGGAFLANDADGEILAACKKTSQLSVEATVTPATDQQTGPARIVTFSTDVNQRDFTLGQVGDRLIVRIRTPQTGPNGVGMTDTGIDVAALATGQANHILVSYKPGRLVCYLNGRLVYESDQIQGDFRDWSAQHLLFGDEYGGKRDWAGTLEGIAIYNRFIEPDEAERHALQYAHRRQSRPRIPHFRVRAKLLEKSSIPSPKTILPHRAALVVYKYRLENPLNGDVIGPDLYVAHWAVLDAKQQPITRLADRTVKELVLEPYEQNPQVRHYFCSDDFERANVTNHRRFLAVQP